MYHGKHSHKKRSRWNKSAMMMASLLLIATMTLGGTLAYIFTGTEDVENTFTPSKVTTAVKETLSGKTKSNVMIENTGSTDAYIRAAVVVTWQDEDGNVYGAVPKTTDYTLNIITTDQEKPDGKWTKGADGFYYWSKPVAPNVTTNILIDECYVNEGVVPPSGYNLAVEIIGSGIQAKGVDANGRTPVELAWGTAAAALVKK